VLYPAELRAPDGVVANAVLDSKWLGASLSSSAAKDP
jgi:hypothetical protein